MLLLMMGFSYIKLYAFFRRAYVGPAEKHK
jgi:hypothetical protein